MLRLRVIRIFSLILVVACFIAPFDCFIQCQGHINIFCLAGVDSVGLFYCILKLTVPHHYSAFAYIHYSDFCVLAVVYDCALYSLNLISMSQYYSGMGMNKATVFAALNIILFRHCP